MDILIGTREGVFASDGGRIASATEGLAHLAIHSFASANGSVLAGTESGVFRSGDGLSWQPSGCEGRAVRAIATAPLDNGTVYAGTQPAALYRSNDGGHSWEEIESLANVPGSHHWGLPGDPTASRALAIVLDGARPDHFWVAVEVGGILETEDGGATWRVSLADDNPDIHMLLRDPGQSEAMYATTGFGRTDPSSLPEEQSQAGVYRSNDGGSTWHYAWTDHDHRYTRPMCIDPRSPHALTVACAPDFRSSYLDADGAQSMLHQSSDGGKTWRSLGDATHSPSTANLTALAPGNESGCVVVGTDSGEVWHVTDGAEWELIVSGLPFVQALLRRD